jgi:hypothetical protein
MDQPSAMIGVSSRGASHSAPAIMHRFSTTGVMAGSGEAIEAVQDAAGQRCQRHEQQERET